MDIKITNKNLVYIIILGFGNKTKPFSKFNKDEKQIIEFVEYGTEGNIKNIRALFKDIGKIKQEEILIEKPRLTNLFELLKFYLLFTNLNIVVIGFSHGSLIIHGAILKLKMIIDNILQERLNSINIITIGSPRYLPKELLLNNQIYNVYNIQDFLKDIKWMFKSYFKIPNFPKKDDLRFKLQMKFENEMEIYYFRDDNFIFVKFINFKLNYLLYHADLNNIFIFFKMPFPNVIRYFLYNKGIIYDFDRKLFQIASNNKIIPTSLDLDLLDDKQIFQLYYLYFGKLDFDIEYLDLNLCKYELHLLSYNQLQQLIKENKNRINNFEFVYYYQEFLKRCKSIDLNIIADFELIKLLKYLIIFDKNKFLTELKENELDLTLLDNLDFDIINSF